MSGSDPGHAPECPGAQRARAWKRIQDEAPDLAKLLKDVQEHFGRPAELEVRLGGERVWSVSKDTAAPR